MKILADIILLLLLPALVLAQPGPGGFKATQTDPFTVSFGKGLPFYTGLTMVIATQSATLTVLYE